MTKAPLVPFTADNGVPWAPESLTNLGLDRATLRAEWRYVMVEEVVGPTVLLARWAWPLADKVGGLFWPGEAEARPLLASVPRALLVAQLYEPNGLRRDPRAGDTFAARGTRSTGWGGRRPVTDLRRLMPDQVIDISADTHEAARLAYLSAAAAVQPERVAAEDDRLAAALREEAEQRRERVAPRLELAAVPTAPAPTATRGG